MQLKVASQPWLVSGHPAGLSKTPELGMCTCELDKPSPISQPEPLSLARPACISLGKFQPQPRALLWPYYLRCIPFIVQFPH